MAGCQRLRCRQLQGSHLHHLPKAGFRAWLHAMESQERQLIRKTTTKGTIFTNSWLYLFHQGQNEVVLNGLE